MLQKKRQANNGRKARKDTTTNGCKKRAAGKAGEKRSRRKLNSEMFVAAATMTAKLFNFRGTGR